MIPYYLLVVLPIGFSLFQWLLRRNYYRTTPNHPIAIFFGIYFLLLALRDSTVGVDIQRYILSFETISQYPWQDLTMYKSTEIGYTFVNKLISVFTDNPQFFLMIMAAVTVIPVAVMYYKESENALLSIALFLIFPVFMMNFSGLRQAIAIALGVPAFYAVKEKKGFLFLSIVVVAFSFHQSALILLLMYPVYHMDIRPKHLLFLIPGFIFTVLNSSRIFTFFLPLFGEKYVERYSEITDTGAYSMLILFLLFLAYAFLIPDETRMDDMSKGLRNFLVLTLFIQTFSSISVITMRMNYYYLIFLPLLIPKITNRSARFDKRSGTIVTVGLTVFFVLYYLVKAHTVDSLNIYPYVPFWN